MNGVRSAKLRRFSAVLAAGVLTIPGLVTVSCGGSSIAEPDYKNYVRTPESDGDNEVSITMDEIKANFAKYYEPYPGGGWKVKDKAFANMRLPRNFALDPDTREIGNHAFWYGEVYKSFALPPKLEVIGGGVCRFTNSKGCASFTRNSSGNWRFKFFWLGGEKPVATNI